MLKIFLIVLEIIFFCDFILGIVERVVLLNISVVRLIEGEWG